MNVNGIAVWVGGTASRRRDIAQPASALFDRTTATIVLSRFALTGATAFPFQPRCLGMTGQIPRKLEGRVVRLRRRERDRPPTARDAVRVRLSQGMATCSTPRFDLGDSWVLAGRPDTHRGAARCHLSGR